MKRSFEDFKVEYKQLKEEIKEREQKRQRLQDEVDEQYPGVRQAERIAKAEMRQAVAARKELDKTLPEPLKKILMDDLAREKWPELGGLVGMTVEPDKEPVNDLLDTYVVRVYLTYERSCRRKFVGVIYPATGLTYPPTWWEQDFDTARFKGYPWKWALERCEGDPVIALFSLITYGVMALEGTDEELKYDEIPSNEALRRMWAKVYPEKKDHNGEDEEEKEKEAPL
jgi:hypothetical protein